MKPIIDPRLRDELPPLSEAKKVILKEDLLARGVLLPFLVWNGTLVDGHNRLEICEEHGIPYETKEIEFDSIEDAKFWICKNQMAQRDMNDFQKCVKALEHEEKVREEAQQRVLAGKKVDPPQPIGEGQKSRKERETDAVLGDFAGVSSETIRRARILSNEAPDDIQEKLFAGEMAIGTAFKKLQDEKKREAAREARRQAREGEAEQKPVKTADNPEGIVGGEPVFHNGELMPGVMRTSAGIVHASRPYDDNPESFPFVMDLVERAVSSFDALIQNAMGKLSAGMLTEENRKDLEKAIRAASRLGMDHYKERMEEFNL